MKMYEYEEDKPYNRTFDEVKFIDLDLLRKYLDSLFIKKRREQNRIISYYRLGAIEHKRKSYLEQALNKLEYAEDTLDKIVLYIVNTSVRNEINKRLEV